MAEESDHNPQGTLGRGSISLVDKIRDGLSDLCRETVTYASCPPVARIHWRAEQLVSIRGTSAEVRPLVVALLGGTGVGKSALFSALVGRAGASPSSLTRGFTKRPQVAGDREAFEALLGGGSGVEADYSGDGLSGILLVDTPDIDSIEESNHERTRKVVELADVLLYVTIPERVGDFVIDDFLKRWGSRKRWFFALNKMDRAGESAKEITGLWNNRLQEQGFDIRDDVCFPVSAVEPESFSLSRLREVLRQVPSGRARRALAEDLFYGRVIHALGESSVLEPVESLIPSLQSAESRLADRVRESYRQSLSSPKIQGVCSHLLKQGTRTSLSERFWGPIGAWLWVSNRLSLLTMTWQMGRMVSRGFSLLGGLWLGASAVVSSLRGWLSYRTLRDALEEHPPKGLEDIRHDAVRVLEDYQLGQLGQPSSNHRPESEESVRTAWLRAIRSIPWIGRETAEAVDASLVQRSSGDDVLMPLLKTIESRGEEIASRLSRSWFQLLVNLPPIAVLLHFGYRVGLAWWEGTWLPMGFYGLAAAVMLLSLIPGILLIRWRVARASRKWPIEKVLGALDHPEVLEPVQQAVHTLQGLSDRSRRILNLARGGRESLHQEMGRELVGTGHFESPVSDR